MIRKWDKQYNIGHCPDMYENPHNVPLFHVAIDDVDLFIVMLELPKLMIQQYGTLGLNQYRAFLWF